MKIACSIPELQIPEGVRVGFVPTMGAFHEGHLQLMRKSTEVCEITVVSLFVNPMQFGKGEDFDKYPRNIASDSEMADSVGVDILFAPTIEEMYPEEAMTMVNVPQVGNRWEGEHRPGHFQGVSTIVAKLLNIVKPDVAFFGRKDFQQCMVIRKLVDDLNYRLELSIEPTIRESDGLAMSSRNRYLSEAERKVAPVLYETIATLREKILNGGNVAMVVEQGVSKLTNSGFDVDYLAYVDDKSLEPIFELRQDSTIICAARLGKTRLIDNIALN